VKRGSNGAVLSDMMNRRIADVEERETAARERESVMGR
jgi:hypothetical protein